MPKSKNLGKVAYEGYHTTRHPNYEKRWEVTPFEEITQGEKENWDDSADAVLEHVANANIGTQTFKEWQSLMRKAINVQNGIASEEDRHIVVEALLRRLDREGFQRISKLVQTARNAAR